MATAQKRQNLRFVLLLEGPEDKHFVQHLCNAHDVPRDSFDYVDKDGFPDLLATIGAELKSGPLEALGIVLDTDENLGNRWEAIVARLREFGYQATPKKPDATGTIISSPDDDSGYGGKRIGIWLMPDNQLPGMLEDFVSDQVPAGDNLWPKAQSVVAAIPLRERRFKATYVRKAEIHTWLAWQEYPGVPLGLAVTRHYLDANHDAAVAFITWLRSVFGI